MHQTFGLWEQDPNAGLVGAGSGGRRISAGAMPSPRFTTGTHTGKARGYSSFSGTISTTAADVRIVTDFSTANFTTSNTTRQGIDVPSTPSAEPEHDMNGTLTVTGAGLSGTVSSGDGVEVNVGPVTVTGTFYGPNAEEVGGTFTNNGATGNFFGAFGAAR